MFGYDLGTEISIKIIRILTVISGNKPALLNQCSLGRLAHAMKCTIRIEKQQKQQKHYSCLYWTLFDLVGKLSQAE